MPSASYKPLARQEHLLTADLEGEIVILDTKTNRALNLNPSMALIWRHCDGETTVAQIAALLREKLHASADESSVWHSLRKLQKAKLLQGEVSIPEVVNLPSRRELFKVLGLGVGAITVMLIPTPAAAATCFPQGHLRFQFPMLSSIYVQARTYNLQLNSSFDSEPRNNEQFCFFLVGQIQAKRIEAPFLLSR